jgi:hypothetical protein
MAFIEQHNDAQAIENAYYELRIFINDPSDEIPHDYIKVKIRDPEIRVIELSVTSLRNSTCHVAYFYWHFTKETIIGCNISITDPDDNPIGSFIVLDGDWKTLDNHTGGWSPAFYRNYDIGFPILLALGPYYEPALFSPYELNDIIVWDLIGVQAIIFGIIWEAEIEYLLIRQRRIENEQ